MPNFEIQCILNIVLLWYLDRYTPCLEDHAPYQREKMLILILNQHICSALAIALKCFSCERCDPWVSCYSLANKITVNYNACIKNKSTGIFLVNFINHDGEIFYFMALELKTFLLFLHAILHKNKTMSSVSYLNWPRYSNSLYI